MKTNIPPVLIIFALICLTLAPQVRAACQEGCLTNFNTVLGEDALLNTTTGLANTAIGWKALTSNTTGGSNTAVGLGVLEHNTDGHDNTGFGYAALIENTSGFENTAVGSGALFSNSTGNNNTAVGGGALQSNTTGNNNTGNGLAALNRNTTGSFNTANGVSALPFNTIGNNNTANGANALQSNTTGNNNTAMGFNALVNNATGSKNIALGFLAGSDLTTGDHNIDIGNPGRPGESSTIRIGRLADHTATFIAGISGATVPTGVAVIVNANGRLGTVVSSERFKDAIKPMDKASEAILALRPVTFHYKKELDPEGIPQFGLVAEDVEKVNPDLVARDEQGKPYTVRYEAVNAMLLNEFLKEHRKNEQQEATIARQQKQIEALTAGLQKVSAQLEASKPAPQVVNNQ